MSTEPELKRIKTEAFMHLTATCKHFVKRKKRFCKMTVAKGQEYCGEHMPQVNITTTNNTKSTDDEPAQRKRRIPCPLDPKHSVYSWNLDKHLKVCNAQITDLPPYIIPGLNVGPDDDDGNDYSAIKLSEVDGDTMNEIVDKVNRMYMEDVEGTIDELIFEHPLLKNECTNPSYGPETLKHLHQTSSLLGYLEHCELLKDATNFIEFGAGKGQVSYWLAQAIANLSNSNVLLVDRASHRHKKDNKIIDRSSVQRIRADIADFAIGKLESNDGKEIVGISKHLCGGATDLALRCILNGNETIKTTGIIIAVCCHHRCTWKPFVGKKYFLQHGISQKQFSIITKMVGWAICGTGLSREKRKELNEKNENINEETSDNHIEINANKTKMTREEREIIGMRCKRLIDYARLCFMNENSYESSLKYYVKSSVTLENVCLVCKLKE